MARIVFIIILAIHGLIHVLGFLKAFNYADIKELTLPISRIFGVFWLLTFLLFLAASILYAIKSNYWQHIAIIAVLVSQILVLLFWQDSKFGTIP